MTALLLPENDEFLQLPDGHRYLYRNKLFDNGYYV